MTSVSLKLVTVTSLATWHKKLKWVGRLKLKTPNKPIKQNHTSYDVKTGIVRAEEGQSGEASLHLLQDPRTEQAREHQEAGLLTRFQPRQAVPGPHAEIR